MKTNICYPMGKITLAILATIIIYGTGCDSSVDSGNGGDSVTLSGRVAEYDETAGKAGNSMQASSLTSMNGVEGAVVTATAIHADGSVSALDGQATTNAEGEFTLVVEGEGAADHVRVLAETEDGFEASAVVQVNGQSSLNTRPITSASHAQASVYVAAKAEDDAESHDEGVTKADASVIVHVDAASEINSSANVAQDIGTALAGAVKAQGEFRSQTNADIDMSAIGNAKVDAYSRFQSALSTSAGSTARANAYVELENDYVTIFSDNGVDFETQAKLHQTGSALLLKAGKNMSGHVETSIRKQAELVRAHATALAVEAMLEAEGASQARLDALADARVTLVAEIRAATSAEAIAEAIATYRASVHAETEAHYSIDASILAAAEAQIESSYTLLNETLANLSILLGGVAEATAEAFAGFYASAQADAKASFEHSGLSEAEAESAAEVVVLLYVLK